MSFKSFENTSPEDINTQSKQSTTQKDSETIIDVSEVFKIYKTESVEVVALRGLDLAVKRGEIISIMGPSGCGKSTMLNIIGALDIPSAGKIRVLGKDLTSMDSDAQIEFRREHIGFVFQFFNLVPTLTAIENIELPLRLVNTPHDAMRKKVAEVLGLVGMEKRGNHRPDELSGGEQQRIAIAAALANDPEIILADEPTGELDSESGQKVLDLLKHLNEEQGKTIIIVTHDSRSATISHRSFRIEDGQIKGEYTREMYTRDPEGTGEVDGEGNVITGGGVTGAAVDPLRYKQMIENMVDKKRRMEELLKEIINMEDEMINSWK